MNGYTGGVSMANGEAAATVVGEVVLRFLEGENEGVELRINPPRDLTIGRSEECDIFLGEKKISRQHCILSVQAAGVSLKDLGSTNGTFLDQKRVTESQVDSGGKIRLGTSVIEVDISAEAAKKPEDASETEKPSPRVVDEPSGVVDIPEVSEPSVPEMEDPLSDRGPLETPETPVQTGPKPLSGSLSAMGLADLLQNLAHNRKSGVLALSAHREGSACVIDGRVVAAETGAAKGNKALYRMLGWNEGKFELLPLPPGFDPKTVDTPITDSVESLLMEGLRQYDEIQKIGRGVPEPKARLKLKSGFSSPLSKLHPRVLDVLQVILNEGVFERVLDKSPLSDLDTSKITCYLLKKGYILSE